MTEPGSLEVFGNIINARQDDEFGNLDKTGSFQAVCDKISPRKAHPSKIEFNLFEAIKGHYSQISIQKGVNVSGRDTLPTENDLLFITELDVFDALANGTDLLGSSDTEWLSGNQWPLKTNESNLKIGLVIFSRAVVLS
ncbi:hypothetical protein O9992_15405 [Vibrio lentus]|nr:hypothetical protein [Vibrio lentus]